MSGGVSIRELETLDELQACVRLQEAVWGRGFSERAPVSILKVSRRLGGVVAGAFDESGEMVGFVFGITGLEDGRPVHWSDMLAVRPGIRDAGVGTRLKLFQRTRCLELGIDRMYWTFDPLEARNARLNFGKLGAVAREYTRDMYGASDSPLHRGLGTDRLVVLWLLASGRVEARLEGRDSPPPPDLVADVPRAFPVSEDGPLPEPGPAEASMDGAGARRVPVPARIQEVKEADPELAVRWREAVREALEAGLARGLQVTELVRAPGPVQHLLLRPRRSVGGRPAGGEGS